MINDSLIILAAGLSSRMKKSVSSKNLSKRSIEQANSRDKGLIGIDKNGRPLIHYLLINAKIAGFKVIYLVIGQNSDSFKSYFDENKYDGLDIEFAVQYLEKNKLKPSGTADALFQAITQFPILKSSNFCVCNSDNLYSAKALRSIRSTSFSNAFISYDKSFLNFSSAKVSSFSILKLNKNGYLVNILEKPTTKDFDLFKDNGGKIRVSMNLFKFNGSVFYDYLKNCPFDVLRNEKELPTAVLNLAKDQPSSVYGIPFEEHVPDLTSKDDIIVLNKLLNQK
ncbi:sugar phosphate nucleotidyltransferase [Flavobacteriaceae bacterium]|jgi:glucose-1-phosphate adenylyltransferase|nr:sugar phosphate nucleotidyltransferase [Flavobacteriaceae bacterium]MDA7717498.1 sugar phosphate nucleotidyltransferase [Flavobacteriaceae bacterium]MDA9977454.1 sugar phosphate nucleotidyltransferase [Flavobacteriaceae bacterium]MDB0023201.1 sugar phosphate nucleotidyltransferase [Flavobacteriaceae bacterium]MDB2567534.1 sugar phosphate nucleotidyltransferase [Flavobacteriaceae bacterium]|tara:strand:- start:9173 stop:10015 length:843 start_codon:yes stop_codon:yes gene_type:complete